MGSLERVTAPLRVTLDRVRVSVLRWVIGDDLLALTLLTMGIREIELIEDESRSQEPDLR